MSGAMNVAPRRSGIQAELLALAARPSLAAIEHDEQRAPENLRPVFAAVRKLLFQPKLSLKRISAAAGVADEESTWDRFREAVGQPPWSYVRDLRLETAARLLLFTSLKVAPIASMVGHKNAAAFRKSFAIFAGTSPSLYRRRARTLLRSFGAPPRDVDDQAYWERALAGELSDEEVRELDGYVSRPLASGRGETVPEAIPWIKMRGEMALALTVALDTLSYADQRLLLRDAVWFPDASLFNLLSLRVEKVAPKDPRRGVELAMLGIDSLAANGLLGVDPGLAVLAWSRVARARWRAADLPGAEDALKQVYRDLERIPERERSPTIEAERSRLEAALRWHQGRRPEALKLVEHSIEQERAGGVGHLHRVLLLRSEIRASLRLPKAREDRELLRGVLEDLEEARSLDHSRWDWEWTVLFDLWVLVLVRLSDKDEMAKALPHVRRLAGELGGHGSAFSSRLRWFEGHVNRSLEALTEAREGFLAANDELWTTRTTLDLLQGGPGDGLSEADGVVDPLKLASELATALGSMAQSSQGVAVAKVIQNEVASGAVTKSILDAAGDALRRLEDDLRAREALRFVAESCSAEPHPH
jgi:AraC-like DNA-binding protein